MAAATYRAKRPPPMCGCERTTSSDGTRLSPLLIPWTLADAGNSVVSRLSEQFQASPTIARQFEEYFSSCSAPAHGLSEQLILYVITSASSACLGLAACLLGLQLFD